MRIRNKIVLIFVVVTAVTLVMLSVFIYLFSIRHAHRYFYTRLKVRASIALHGYLEEGQSEGVLELRERHLQMLPDEREYIVRYDSTTRQWKGNALPMLSQTFYAGVQESGYAEWDNDFVHYVGVNDATAPGVISVATARDDEGAVQMQSLLNLLMLAVVFGSVFVFGLGRLLAAQIIKPVSDIIEEVNRISASSLDKRLSTAKGEDEIAALAQTFNSMLDRLHVAFQLQSNFISNASHELRTPLTAILGESDVTLSGERSCDEYKKSIQAIRTEAEKLNDLVTSLLQLSQVGFDGKRQMLEPVSVDLLLMKIKNEINKRFPNNHLHIELKDVPENPDALVLMCIPTWMELALLNIVNNAIKYSDNKDVLVTLSATEHELSIRISDLGIGISETDMKHVFELFFRGSNSQAYVGHGIGLPLADKIIRLHGGRIDILSRPNQGTTVVVNFNRNQIRKR
ncbi:HAMP domain-containing sensor histidine kinase [Chryseolinea lacunae]|uniref:histidine kinase n=1 Tax=Chryseolinea lacunae TaxID=2801331 RepID=A0ABS1KPG1_9BACT|nr:HAMP domain-containing sensor histidine kinase [Chryseolinea lacunae]MBL0741311.1 HAMP domain-containing histidine kinase [Chryseolinea lacunae]